MNKKDRDFIVLFNAFWYRDFPLIKLRPDISSPALWTTHIASTVKRCADHLGLFTCFETGGKTDAVIEYANADKWAKIEWEWFQPKNLKVNEIEKLSQAAINNEAQSYILISYSEDRYHEENIEKIREQWGVLGQKLIVFLVNYSWRKQSRNFNLLQTYLFSNGKYRKIREQKALPWEIEGTKWYVEANSEL